MLSGRGLCDELVTRPEESYRLCCVVVCDLETSRTGAPYIYDISSLRVNILCHFLFSCYRIVCKLHTYTVFLSNFVTTNFDVIFIHPSPCPSYCLCKCSLYRGARQLSLVLQTPSFYTSVHSVQLPLSHTGPRVV